MPLTPEDVANKQFTSTRLKPGYDETEVDEFLDEVEAELTRLYRENDELRSKVAQTARVGATEAPDTSAMQREIEELRSRLAAAQRSAQTASPGPDTAAVQRENEELRQKLVAVQRQLAEAQSRAAAAPQPAAGQSGVETATGILALAQRTADEHVAEARTQADRLLAEARTRADQLKRESEDRHRQTLGTLETERATLERKVEQLRAFEREYRARLKSYLEGQLRELEGRDAEASAGARQAQNAPGVRPPQHVQPSVGPAQPVAPQPGQQQVGQPQPGQPQPQPGQPQPGQPQPSQPQPGTPQPAQPQPGTPQPGNPFSPNPAGGPGSGQPGGPQVPSGPPQQPGFHGSEGDQR